MGRCLDKAELAGLLAELAGGRDPTRVLAACDTDRDGHVSDVEFSVNQM